MSSSTYANTNSFPDLISEKTEFSLLFVNIFFKNTKKKFLQGEVPDSDEEISIVKITDVAREPRRPLKRPPNLKRKNPTAFDLDLKKMRRRQEASASGSDSSENSSDDSSRSRSTSSSSR